MNRFRWIVVGIVACFGVVFSGGVIAVLSHGSQPHRRGIGGNADGARLAKSIARLRTDTGNTTAACLTNMNNLTSAVMVSGCLPVGQSTAPLCNAAPQDIGCWGGPYVTTVVNDAWNLPYTASIDATSHTIMVRSAGPNGIADDSDDVTYQQ